MQQYRRIDDLGRIVIPKEIRRELKIETGTCCKIYLEDGIIKLEVYDENEQD